MRTECPPHAASREHNMVAFVAKIFICRPNHFLPRNFGFLLFFSFLSMPCITMAQADQSLRPPPAYADVADLVSASPLIAKARINRIESVNGSVTNPAQSSKKYALVTARIESLIRGTDGLPQKVRFLVVLPSAKNSTDRDTKRWRKGMQILIFARAGDRLDALQLVSRNAIQPWNTELDAITRALTTEILSARPAPAIVSVGDAFHVAGTVAGESETQIFLKTATGEPVSLSVVHRSGEAPRWGVSLGEIVDDTAAPPKQDTLLWYRLACGLPEILPAASTRGLALLDAEAARRDYRFVMESLGRCGRTL